MEIFFVLFELSIELKAKKTLSSENIPVLDMDEIDKFASYINNLIDKRIE